jgi:hypothetical protein
MPIEIKQEALRRLQDRPWSRYPEFTPSNLIRSLAAFSGWTADGTLVGNGSNELIQALLMVVVSEGKRVLFANRLSLFTGRLRLPWRRSRQRASLPALTYDVDASRPPLNPSSLM